MDPITLRDCIRPAWTTTLHSFGLDQPRKRAISFGVVAVALLLLGKLKGWDFVMDQIWWIVALVGATILGLGVVFVVTLMRAPLEIANELVGAFRQENESLKDQLKAASAPPATKATYNLPRGINLAAYEFQAQAARKVIPQASVNELAQIRVQGVQLFQERLPEESDLDGWVKREESWREAVMALLTKDFSQAVAMGFQTPGPRLGQAPMTGSVNNRHRELRRTLNRRIEILGEIISKSA